MSIVWRQPPLQQEEIIPQHHAEPQPFLWLRQLLSFWGRRWKVIAFGLILMLMLAAAYIATARPQFTASADLLYDIRRTYLLKEQQGIQDSQTINAMVESQVELLQSEGLAHKVVERLKLNEDPAFTNWRPGFMDRLRQRLTKFLGGKSLPAADPDSVIAQQLLRMINVHRVGLTYVISVSVTSGDPEQAAKLTNGFAEAYIADELDAKSDTTNQTKTWLEDRLTELRDQAMKADRAVQDFKIQNNIVDTGKGLMDQQQLIELSTQLEDARAKTADSLAKLQRIQSILQTGVVDGVADGAVTDALKSPIINNLRQKYLDDASRVSDLAAKYGATHIAVVNLKSEMASIQHAIADEIGHIAETYKSDYEVNRATEDSIQKRLNDTVNVAAKTDANLVTYRSLESSANIYRSLYENFLQRYTQTVQDQSFPVPEARIVTPATPPLVRSSPKVTVTFVLCALVGLMLGMVLALMREIMDRRIYTEGQLLAATGVPFIARVPMIRARPHLPATPVKLISNRTKTKTKTEADRKLPAPPPVLRQAIDYPHSAFAQAIRTVGIRISRQQEKVGDTKLIGCVSVRPGAGTTTVAVNLAHFLAHGSSRTALIDWDFGAASLSKLLLSKVDDGFLDVASGFKDLPEVTWHDVQTGLRFLPSGSNRAEHAARRLSQSERAGTLLANLRDAYDYVVIDLPSLAQLTDAHAAMHLLDGIVVVVEWGNTNANEISAALAALDLDESFYLGSVMTKVDPKSARRYADH